MFKAAFYETEVTPPLESPILGHFKPHYGKNVKDRLYTKAVVIDNGIETVATVVLDCVHFPLRFHEEIIARVGEYTGIKPENITVAANHSHAGAPTRSVPEIECYTDEGYINNLIKIMADCITLAYRNLEPVKVSYACGKVYDISFNRNFVMRDGSITTNTGRDEDEPAPLNVPDDIPVYKFEDVHNMPGAKIYNPNCVGNLAGIDPDVPVLMFTNEKGEKIGAVINFACHQTASGGTEFSGDYSSAMSDELKKEYGQNFVSLFLIGTCGDINHIDFSRKKCKPDIYKIMGKRLADEVKAVVKNAVEITDETLLAKKEKLYINKRHVETEEMIKACENFIKQQTNARKGMLRNMLMAEAVDNDAPVEVYVQSVRIGDVYFYALPGEVFVNFGLYIKEKSPGSKNIITELANGSSGYIPTREVFHPNSTLYEKSVTKGTCMEIAGGYIISEKAVELANTLKNQR